MSSDPNYDASFYTLTVLGEDKKQVYRANSMHHFELLGKIVERQRGIDMNKEYLIADETDKAIKEV